MIKDQLYVMLQREYNYNVPYTMSRADETNSVMQQHRKWRGQICEWCYCVVDHYEFDREVVSLAMDYFDRQVLMNVLNTTQMSGTMCSKDYQLVAMTCLYVASKTHVNRVLGSSEESRRQIMHLSSFVNLSRGQFTTDDIISAEKSLLDSLDWRVNPVTPMSFVSYMLGLFHHSCEIKPRHWDSVLNVLHESSRYLTELAVCLPEMTELKTLSSSHDSSIVRKSFPPSYIAFASILISMEMLTQEAMSLEFRNAFSDIMGQLSTDAAPCRSNFFFLHSDNEDIQYLMQVLLQDFRPHMILDQAGDTSTLSHQHPICVAQRYGLINIGIVTGADEDTMEQCICRSEDKGIQRDITCVSKKEAIERSKSIVSVIDDLGNGGYMSLSASPDCVISPHF
mmetsp:Transcript_7859/g.7446  ORF Transcript_7859/g.7446 Transcript_7859/m.7446 type:complete len:395 (-) Transcript_7859:143-1327(-)|eukprot:CAMPEP_0197833156 /NCGR_PEP_ID=MMETSP1437-20131217/18031_1 /TAXON_ID=49252 ORGANISM="Eucampia antarctica, Strain CCMP1452" /NCGR_SAMPLE_ID=MMETSP1437 /ASSEMBLY_ACC=CAM_ASM_001096 /LENGTH=394 /DNA_ID=CAMNT_0043437037 /DNA_START=191 /DNA_END=1375 /DNA_ORIENTATION=-